MTTHHTTADSQTARLWKSTIKNLRMIYALTGESMVSIVDRLVAAELERLQRENADR